MREVRPVLTESLERHFGGKRPSAGTPYPVASFKQLTEEVARLAYKNKDYLLFFRGQNQDFQNRSGASSFYPSIYRGDYLSEGELQFRFETLSEACRILRSLFTTAAIEGHQELSRKEYIRWSILQHYEVCATPLLDLTHSLRVAASFSLMNNFEGKGFVYVFGFPFITNRISINSEHDLVNVRLLSICPPDALRPYFQDGYLAGTTDVTSEYEFKNELDFNRRLLAKFSIANSGGVWGEGFSAIPKNMLLPEQDRVKDLCQEIRIEAPSRVRPGEMGRFMIEWSDLESALQRLVERELTEVGSTAATIRTLSKRGVLPDRLVSTLDEVRRLRNRVAHRPQEVESWEVNDALLKVKEIAETLRHLSRRN